MSDVNDDNTARCLLNVQRLCRHHIVHENIGAGNCMFLAMGAGYNNNAPPISRRLLTQSMSANDHIFGFDAYGGLGSSTSQRGFTREEGIVLAGVSDLLRQLPPSKETSSELTRIFQDVYLPGVDRDGTWGTDREIAAMAHFYEETRGTIVTLTKIRDPSKEFQGIQLFCPDAKVYCLSFPDFFSQLDVAEEKGHVYFTYRGNRTQVLLSTQGLHYERLQPSPGILD
jgi:hypothetical protein